MARLRRTKAALLAENASDEARGKTPPPPKPPKPKLASAAAFK